ncbi:transcription factor GTE12-like [Rhizophagus clarus]|uniref:Transcription factor GTE12-like n=1 Tax=Rhizophagus clarus TaxID=94130 RepID=A0A8H3QFE8_9GLOM|nr:transcription factor GTE12-like [Rhizophagus clarus]
MDKLNNIDETNNMEVEFNNYINELNNIDELNNAVELDNTSEFNIELDNTNEFNIELDNSNEFNIELDNSNQFNIELDNSNEFNIDELFNNINELNNINNTDDNMDELNNYFDELDNMGEINDINELSNIDGLDNNMDEINNSADELSNTDDETDNELESYLDELSMNISGRYLNQFFSQYIQMSTVTNKYLGQDILIFYIKEKHTNSSYYEFLILHHDTFDDYWTQKFLEEIEKSKLNKKNTFDVLKQKINTEHLQYENFFQIYWQRIIKKYKKENLIPDATYTKKTIKIHGLPKVIEPNLLFCYKILCELIMKPYSFPFYKYTKEVNPDYFDIIDNPIDLFTIKSKLENNQYSDAEKFKKDIDLLFDNNSIYYNINGSEFYNLTIMFKKAFNMKWNKKYR